MVIEISTLKELCRVGGISETALTLVRDAEDLYITDNVPEAEDNELRDSVLVDLCRNRLAYMGYTTFGSLGLTGSWEDQRREIISALLPEIQINTYADDS